MMKSSDTPAAAFASLFLALLTGCGIGVVDHSQPILPSASISGKVFGGQQPVKNSSVTVYQMGSAGYGTTAAALASTTSDQYGNFQFPANAFTCTNNPQVYVTAIGGDAGYGSNTSLALAAGLGACSSAQDATVNINEVTTVATAFALGQFFGVNTGGSTPTDSFGAPPTDMASLTTSNTYTIPMLVNLATGTVQRNTSAIAIEAAKIYSIANVLAACVNSAGNNPNGGACATLFSDTTSPNGSAPSDTLQAAVNMSLYPYQNVSDLYNLSIPEAPFIGLSIAPNDWTLGVSYTTSNMALAIPQNSSSTIAIDASGNVWFPTNKSGAAGVGYFAPASGSFNGPYGSTSGSATITDPLYLTIDKTGNVWVTDLASPSLISVNSTNPAQTSSFTLPATDPSTGTTITSTGPIDTDLTNSLIFGFIGSGYPLLAAIDSTRQNLADMGGLFGNDYVSSLVASNFIDSGATTYYAGGSGYYGESCELADESTGRPNSGYGTGGQLLASTTAATCVSGGIANTGLASGFISAATTVNQVCIPNIASPANGCYAPTATVNLPEGIATDGQGNEWIANSGNGSVSTFASTYQAYNPSQGQIFLPTFSDTSPVPYLHNGANGNTLTAPYGIAIDGSGNVWFSNAGCVSISATQCTPTAFVLSELIGAASPTITPLSAQNSGNLTGTEP